MLQISTTLRRSGVKAARSFILLLFVFVISVVHVVGQDIPVLRDGLPVVGDLDGGEHFLAVELKQGQTVRLEIQEKGVNVSVALITMADERIVRFVNFGAGYDRETLTYVAEQTGTYVIVVGTRRPPRKGRYVLHPHIEETTAAPRERVKAEQLLEEGLAKSNGNPSELRQSLVKLKESLVSWKKLSEAYWEAYTLFNIGRVHEDLQERAEALDYYNQALPRIRQAQDINGEATTLNSIGLIHSQLGDKTGALDYYKRAQVLIKQVGNLPAETMGFHNLGAAYSDLGDRDKALHYYNQALVNFKQLNNKLGEANSLLGLGEVYSDLGAYAKAIDYFTQAAKVFKDAGELRGAGTALHDIGQAYYDLNEMSASLDYFEQALKIFVPLGNQRDLANTFRAVGWVYHATGENAAALNQFHQALSLLKDIDDLRTQASILNAIGIFYGQLGEKAKALDYFQQALPRFRQAKDEAQEAETLLYIAMTYHTLRKYKETRSILSEALLLFKRVGNKNREGVVLYFIGGTYLNEGDKAQGVSYIREALPTFESRLSKNKNAIHLSDTGFLYSILGEKEKAHDYFNLSLAYSRYDNNSSGEPFILEKLTRYWEESGNRRLAIFYSKLSVNSFQRKRADVQAIDSELQKSFLREFEGGYKHLAGLLIEEGQIEQAVRALNLYQDERLLDYQHDSDLSKRRVEFSPPEQAISARYKIAFERVGTIGSKIELLKQQTLSNPADQPEPAEMRTLNTELKTAVDECLKVIKDAEAEFAKPRDGKDQPAAVPDVAEMQSALRELSLLNQKAAAIYTLIGKDKFYVVLITPNGELKSFQTPIKQDDLAQKLTEFHALLQSPTYDPRRLGQELYTIIFKPIEPALKESGVQTLLWRLDSNLRYVPMAALFDGEKYLIENYQNVVFTRTDTAGMLRLPNSRWTGFGFGSSQKQTIDLLGDKNEIHFSALPGVLQELQSIFGNGPGNSGVLNGTVFTDKGFTKNTFYEALKQHRPVVHIASHFSFRPGDDSRSFLLLGDSTALTLNEMKKQEKLFAGVELLTLSACNTAATQADSNGKEIDGFAELAQRLGAASVMATLWPVSDSSTFWLMKGFYRMRQAGDGTTKAEALRRAQLALLDGTGDFASASVPEKTSANSQVRVVVVPDASKQARDLTRAEIIYVSDKDAPLFVHSNKKPFAHPYYWSPFVLFGNWR